jgi:hypothetical protein
VNSGTAAGEPTPSGMRRCKRRDRRTVQCSDNVASFSKTVARIFLEQTQDDSLEVGGNSGTQAGWMYDLFRYLLHHHDRCRRPGERRLARHHIVCDGPQRIEIGPAIELPITGTLLG